MGQNPVPPVNIPISTKTGSKMGSAPTNGTIGFDNHSHALEMSKGRSGSQLLALRQVSQEIRERRAEKLQAVIEAAASSKQDRGTGGRTGRCWCMC